MVRRLPDTEMVSQCTVLGPDTQRAVMYGTRGGVVTRERGRAGNVGVEKVRYAPPSQAAILVLDRRIGSLAIISIALRG